MRKLAYPMSMLCVLLVLAACSEKPKSNSPNDNRTENVVAEASSTGPAAEKREASDNPQEETIARLNQVYVSMKILNALNHSDLMSQLKPLGGSNMSLQQKWALLVKENADKLEMAPAEVEQRLCIDGWGRRFIVDTKTNLASRKTPPIIRRAVFNLVIWSAGPNGRNEFGKGDDIIGNLPVVKKGT